MAYYIALGPTSPPEIKQFSATEAQAITALGPFATIEEAQRQFALAFPKPDWC
jgi:hypothetical protein